MTQTPNYNLNKFEGTDKLNPTTLNGLNANADTIDTTLKNLNDNKANNTAFTGTDGVNNGTMGLVPAPTTNDANKFLKADGTWDTAGGGGGTGDYAELTNKPSINNVTLNGNKTPAELGLPQIQYSTTDLTAGTSTLETGSIYFVYE